ncbi:hypothetical protein KPG66_08420 [Mycetohabitans sp. B2]|uniref:hypothetical protein n=1 Tax=Mycetohabitans sp. B2 TaxID=2841274 RepID=UPI001F21B551|nr:hypothetical protein [Mycetohabitans sp. B2]MCF7696115.1 hypothetical protein [Mycetohabitans sp. B2]
MGAKASKAAGYLRFFLRLAELGGTRLGIPPLGPGGARAPALNREMEYRIYRRLRCTLGARLAHGAPVPLVFLVGTHSGQGQQVRLDATRRIVVPPFDWIDGSPWFPPGAAA